MAPEQARGQAVDRRADIWAFGVVLFEMLAGRRLFEGETVSDTLAAVLRRRSTSRPFPKDPRDVRPPALERCLERNPKGRLRDIGEARFALDAIRSRAGGTGRGAGHGPAEAAPRGVRPRGRRCARGDRRARRREIPRPSAPVATAAPPIRFTIETPDAEGTRNFALISPDGRQVAWGSQSTIWVRRLDQLQPKRTQLPWQGTLQCWTRDGRLVVLRENRKNGELWQVGTDGGEPRRSARCRRPASSGASRRETAATSCSAWRMPASSRYRSTGAFRRSSSPPGRRRS